MHVLSMGSDFYPDKLIDTFQSLIWTERYREWGEFELKTANISRTMLDLPLGSMVTLLETREVMFVETHEIDEDEDGAILTVTGRSFETFMENRVARPIGGEILYSSTDKSLDWVPNNGLPDVASNTAGLMIQERMINTSLYGQNVPNFQVYITAATRANVSRTIPIKLGNLYERVIDVLKMDDLGVRNNRPVPGSTPEMSMLIYDGTDRTATVVLSTSAGHFQRRRKYLKSIRDYKNSAWGFSYYNHHVSHATGAGSLTGLDRRFGVVDATDIKTTNPTVTDPTLLPGRNHTYLGEHKKTNLFDGTVSPNIPYKYPANYDLGDTIKVIGDYGISHDMLVDGFTRVHDEKGEIGWPTLREL